MSRAAPDPERLLYDAQWGIRHGFPARELVAMLDKLVQSALPGSPPALFGMRQLAALIVAEQPWRAARLCHSVLAHGDDEQALAVLGLAHTLLGHYRAAARAYFRAAALIPSCPIVSHNLGHLLDVGLDRPHDALGYLLRSHEAEPRDREIAASYAHALVRSGERAEAERVLRSAVGDEQAEELLQAWSADAALPTPRALSG